MAERYKSKWCMTLIKLEFVRAEMVVSVLIKVTDGYFKIFGYRP